MQSRCANNDMNISLSTVTLAGEVLVLLQPRNDSLAELLDVVRKDARILSEDACFLVGIREVILPDW